LATYGSDEEQVEALKGWWKDNGTSVLSGIVMVLVVFFGTRQWQAMEAADNGAASDLYQQIADLATSSLQQNQTVPAESLPAAQSIYATLKAEHADSLYTRYAALAMARFQVEQGDLAQAATELQWVLDNPDRGFMQEVDEELLLTARLRLARVKLAQGEAEAALALLQAVEPGTFASGYAEVTGDVLISLGRRDEARLAYQRALATSETGNDALLRLKLQDLGVGSVGAP